VTNKNKLLSIQTTVITLCILGGVYYWFSNIRLPNGLKNFKEITAEDPLFASPEINAEEMDSSITYLEKKQSDLMKAMNVNEQFTPTPFMRAMVEVKKSDDIFKQNPTRQNAINLIGSYKSASHDYGQGVQQILDKVNQYFPTEGKVQPFIYVTSATTNKVVGDDLRLMLENKLALDKEIQKRERRLDGWEWYISPNKNPIPSIATKNDPALSPEEAFRSLPGATVSPGVYQVSTSCYTNDGTETPFYYLLLPSLPSNDRPIFSPKEASTYYYEKFNSSDRSGQKYLSQGIEWHGLHEGTTYRCNNLEYQPQIIMMDSFLARYQVKPIFNNGTDDKIQDAMAQEKRVLTSETHSLSEFESLSDYYYYFYRQERDKNSVRAQALLERYLFIRNKQADFNLILNTDFYFDNISHRIEKGAVSDPKLYAAYLYTMRSNYSVAFFNFSDSVWRLSEKPKYTTSGYENDRAEKYQTYNELLKSYNADQIKRFESITEAEIISGY